MSFDYETLNPGIRKLVKLLRDQGWETTDSGDGKTHDFPECDRDYPYVCVEVDAGNNLQNDADDLLTFLESRGLKFSEQGPDATPCIQATYDPVNQVSIIDVMHVDDALLEKAQADL